MTTLKGLSWGHRRATAPLVALVRAYQDQHPDVTIEWIVRPLSDFEHQGIDAAARQADLIVFDHPFCGDIVASGAFVDLAEVLADQIAVDQGAAFIGPSLETYRFQGGHWGAPVDGATMHAILRADLLEGYELPTTWDEAIALGASLKKRGQYIALPAVSPHSLLAAGSLMANAGAPWTTSPNAETFEVDTVQLDDAIDLITKVMLYAPPEALHWNSIDLHDAMAARNDLAYCPCVFGYATYGEADLLKRLSFAPFAGRGAQPDHGSMIGGAAIGLSTHCAHPAKAAAFIAFCMAEQPQSTLVAQHHGQPAHSKPWQDEKLDARFNGYFSAVGPSMAHCWVRPRFKGYPKFQSVAGKLFHQFLLGDISKKALISGAIDAARDVETKGEQNG